MATILFVDFSLAFESIHKGKMDQILLAYGLPKETVMAIMMLYSNMKVKVCWPDGDTDFFDIADWVRGYISPISLHNLSRQHTLNIDWSNKRKWLYTKKGTKADDNYIEQILEVSSHEKTVV